MPGFELTSSAFEEGQRIPQGANGFGENGYGGPCPPPGHGAHRYQHELFALDTELDLEPESSRKPLEDAVECQVLAGAELIGTYERT